MYTGQAARNDCKACRVKVQLSGQTPWTCSTIKLIKILVRTASPTRTDLEIIMPSRQGIDWCKTARATSKISEQKLKYRRATKTHVWRESQPTQLNLTKLRVQHKLCHFGGHLYIITVEIYRAHRRCYWLPCTRLPASAVPMATDI